MKWFWMRFKIKIIEISDDLKSKSNHDFDFKIMILILKSKSCPSLQVDMGKLTVWIVFPTVAIRMNRSSPLVPLDSCLTAAACLSSAC